MTGESASRNRDFRRVWAATASAALGSEIGELALPILALAWLRASPQELSWIRASTFLPYLLFTLWLGVVVDRRRRRPLLIGAELTNAVVLLTVALLAIMGWLTVPILVGATFVLGTMSVLHMLADFSFVPQIVTKQQLPDANAKITATYSAIGIGGSGVGGAAVQILTAPIAVAMNGLARLLAVVLLTRVQTVEEPPPVQDASTRAQATQGLVLLAKHRIVRALAGEATIWNLGNELLMLALTVAIVSSRHDGALALGLVLVSGGIGAFLGATVSARLTSKFGYGRSLIASLLVGNSAPLLGIMMAPDTSTRSLAILAFALFFSGLGLGVANSQAVTVRQLAVEESQRGKVNAAYRLLSWGALSIGALAGGLIMNISSAHATALVGAALMALSTIPVIVSPVRDMNELPE